jgi:3-oxoacyl-[acyl-carrier protein] reductase
MPAETSFFGLAGKKGLIIGGGQGMGESTALFLARAGCDVALVDLVAERADAVDSADGQPAADAASGHP